MKKLLTLLFFFISLSAFSQQSQFFSNRIDTTKYAIADTTGNGANNYEAPNTNPNFNVMMYIQGYSCNIKFLQENTGAATIAFTTKAGSLMAIPLVKGVSTPLAAGDIEAGKIHHIVYDGSNFQIPALGNAVALDSTHFWHVLGNAGTTNTTNFLGTTDNNGISFRTNDTIRWQMRPTGQFWVHQSTDSVAYDLDSLGTNPVMTGNVALGDSSGNALRNTRSLQDTSGAYCNTLVGNRTGLNLVNGVSNTLIGCGSGLGLIGKWGYSGHNPGTAFGYEYEITAIGAYTQMIHDTNVYESLMAGAFSGQFNRGHSVVLLGLSAGRYNKQHGTIAIGNHTLTVLDIAGAGANGDNIGIGGNAGLNLLQGSRNIFVGGHTGESHTAGSANTYVGTLSGIFQTSGGNNTYIGYYTGNGGTNQNQSIRIGDLAGQFLNKSLTGIIGSGANCANATDDSTQTGFYQQYAATAATSWNKSNGQWGINDGTQGKGKRFVCEDANGYGHWGTSAMDTTAGDAATQNASSGRIRKDQTGSTYTVTNSYCTVSSKITLTLKTTGVTAGYQISALSQTGAFIITFETAGVASAPNKDVDIDWHLEN